MVIRFSALLAVASVLLLEGATCFVPHRSVTSRNSHSKTVRSFGVDPSVFHDLSHGFRDAIGSFTIADVDIPSTIPDAIPAAIPDPASVIPDPASFVPDPSTALSPEVVEAAGDAVDAAVTDNGWFGFLTAPIEGLLQIIHSVLGVGLENAWGYSIIVLTVLIKLLTLPLTRSQLESTNKMQALQPQVKELQAKYQSNPEVMNQKISEVYQSNNVNPLAGCIPSLVQIPVFIGLYRAVLNLAKEDKLNEPFLWLPNLEGPTYGADPSSGSDWLFKGWVDGVPSLGWEDTQAFLILPVVLVVSQFVSMELMQPKDPAARQDNVVLKILPVMIGWFSLNVPAALCVYWVVNNVITTATTLLIRNSLQTEPAMAAGGAGAATMEAPKESIFAPSPLKPKPEGFSTPSSFSSDDVKPITKTAAASTIIDAEVEPVVKEEPVEAETPSSPVEDKPAGEPMGSTGDDDAGGSKKKRRKGKKKKGKKN